MASDTFKHMLIGFILFVLFTSLLLGVVVDVGVDQYGKDGSQIFGGSFNQTEYTNYLGEINEETEELKDRFTQEGFLFDIDLITGVFEIFKDMINFLLTPWQFLSDILINVLRVPAVVVAVMLGIIVLVIILGIWRLIKAGD